MKSTEALDEFSETVKFDIDRSAFQKMQDTFCASNRVYAICFDTAFRQLTDFSGNWGDEDFIRAFVTSEMLRALVASMSDTGVENVVAMECSEPYVCVSGVAIRDDEQRLMGVMIIFGLIGDLIVEDDPVPFPVITTDITLYQNAVALMEILLKHYFHEKAYAERLESRLTVTETSGNHLKELLKKNEVITTILKRMESDNDFSKVAEDILGDVGSFMDLGNACLLRLNPDGVSVDMICEWTGRGAKAIMPEYSNMTKDMIPFFTSRPYTVSSEAILPENFQNYFTRFRIKAGVFLPLLVNEKLGMYLCFTESEKPRNWSVDDVKLLNDVKLVLQNILTRRVTQNSLASSYAALDAIMENSGCGICVNDVEGKEILFTNENFQSIFSNYEDRRAFEEMLLCGESFEDDISEYYTEGTKHWYHVSFADIRWVDGRMVQLSTLYDITENKNYQKRIEEQAVHDFLTGLYNRMRFEKDLRETVRDAVRSGEQGTFLYVDLDDFKDINDGLGHAVGDEFIQKTAVALETICRGKAMVYRLGGDEFAVLIPPSSHEHTMQLISTIQARFGELWHLGDSEYFCTACVGVVSFPQDGTKVETLMQRADIAMYAAKQSGKNKIEYYNTSDHDQQIHRLDLEREMRNNTAEDFSEFEIYYQPMIDVDKEKGKCIGAEALLRWNSSRFGLLRPDEFIPLAEYLGLIVPIGEHVLKEACAACKYWNDFGHPELGINVNLSVVQLVQGNVCDTVERVLNATGLKPDRLTLELTESVAAYDQEKLSVILLKLKDLGVSLSLDDFGTGYSSLGRLRALPMDELKIDKCFIDKIGTDDFSNTFVDTVSSLAKSIDLRVVAEGVEDELQNELLEKMNVDVIQGYLYDKPMTRQAFEAKYLL